MKVYISLVKSDLLGEKHAGSLWTCEFIGALLTSQVSEGET